MYAGRNANAVMKAGLLTGQLPPGAGFKLVSTDLNKKKSTSLNYPIT